MPTAAFTTLGCKVNQYETHRILRDFERAGFAIVPFDAPADVYVINTCSVTAVAESKSRYTIRRATRTNPEAKVVVTGCAAQMVLNQSAPLEGADLVVENPAKLQTLERLLAAFPYLAGIGEPASNPPPARRTRATLKVQDGCEVRCSYCSIPDTRPGMVSRPWREVVDEARALVDEGHLELVLTGVLIGAYGPDSGSGGPGFEELVAQIAQAARPARIRISSIEMRQVTPDLIDLVASGVVVPHLHIPLQSGDSGVLADMNRPYDQAQYLALVSSLRRRVPGITLTTDVLVGFPTETEHAFEQTRHVCRQAAYYKVHVFPFSLRPGTPADRWGDPIDPAVKQARRKRLGDLATETAREHARTCVGRTLRVLVESTSGPGGLARGLSDHYVEVEFAGAAAMHNTFQWVRADSVDGVRVVGEVVAAPAPTRMPLAVR